MDQPMYSLNHLKQVSGDDPEFMLEILEMFMNQATQEVGLIEQYAADKKWDDVKFVAHRLRSAAGSVGAKKIATTSSELEQYILSADDIEKSVLLYIRIFSEASETELEEIKAVINSLRNRSNL